MKLTLINNNIIEFTNLNDFKSYIPIKIKKFNDKIWYLKDDIITNEINFYRNNVDNSTINNFKIVKKYNRHYLTDKLIFKEHIFNDFKTIVILKKN